MNNNLYIHKGSRIRKIFITQRKVIKFLIRIKEIIRSKWFCIIKYFWKGKQISEYRRKNKFVCHCIKVEFFPLWTLLQIPDQLPQTLFLLFITFFNGSNFPFDKNRRFKPSIFTFVLATYEATYFFRYLHYIYSFRYSYRLNRRMSNHLQNIRLPLRTSEDEVIHRIFHKNMWCPLLWLLRVS